MTQRENEIQNQVIDLEEVVRQQEEYILQLEVELLELTDKWRYVQEELESIQIQKELQKEMQ